MHQSISLLLIRKLKLPNEIVINNKFIVAWNNRGSWRFPAETCLWKLYGKYCRTEHRSRHATSFTRTIDELTNAPDAFPVIYRG